MGFTWNKNSGFIKYETIQEIRANIDSVKDNMACITHKSSDYWPHNVGALESQQSSNRGTDKATNFGGDNNSMNDSENAGEQGGKLQSYKGTHWPGYKSSQKVTN